MAAKKQSALMKDVQISEALAVIVGRGPTPRTEVTKNSGNTSRRKVFKIKSKDEISIQMKISQK